MVHDQKKKNMYAILFFLAILFIAVGFERGGALSGLYTRQFATFPETWIVNCAYQDIGKDLARSFIRTFTCNNKNLEQYCSSLAVGTLELEKSITLNLICNDPPSLERIRNDCIISIRSVC